jgi:hypothetical protein
MPADTSAAAPVATNFAAGVYRFLPHVESKEYQASDLRMDGNITGQVGYLLQGASATVWAGTWAGAAQVASVAAAAAVVALTF